MVAFDRGGSLLALVRGTARWQCGRFTRETCFVGRQGTKRERLSRYQQLGTSNDFGRYVHIRFSAVCLTAVLRYYFIQPNHDDANVHDRIVGAATRFRGVVAEDLGASFSTPSHSTNETWCARTKKRRRTTSLFHP